MGENAVYFRRRELTERALAQRSANERVRDVHQRMAERYSELAQLELSEPAKAGGGLHP